jgi:hypothetical protein
MRKKLQKNGENNLETAMTSKKKSTCQISRLYSIRSVGKIKSHLYQFKLNQESRNSISDREYKKSLNGSDHT